MIFLNLEQTICTVFRCTRIRMYVDVECVTCDPAPFRINVQGRDLAHLKKEKNTFHCFSMNASLVFSLFARKVWFFDTLSL